MYTTGIYQVEAQVTSLAPHDSDPTKLETAERHPKSKHVNARCRVRKPSEPMGRRLFFPSYVI